MTILPEYFTRISSAPRQRHLFSHSVQQIEIETHSYCNRTCWFCPNSYIDRRSANHRMDEALYLRIMADLASIRYRGSITFSRYEEPLADRIILTRIRQARSACPHAEIFTHTNGDYLTRPYVDELHDAGLNKLRVQVYGQNDDHSFDDDEVIARMEKRMADLDLPFEFFDQVPGHHHAARHYYSDKPTMEVLFEANNFAAMGLDRGQTVPIRQDYQRSAPCWLPFTALYIDWDGHIVPCCNIRSDEPRHAAYIVDDLSTGRSIFQAYADSALVDWRNALKDEGPKKPPCNTCSYFA